MNGWGSAPPLDGRTAPAPSPKQSKERERETEPQTETEAETETETETETDRHTGLHTDIHACAAYAGMQLLHVCMCDCNHACTYIQGDHGRSKKSVIMRLLVDS